MDELRNKIAFALLAEETQLCPDDQRLVDADPALANDLLLNRALASGKLTPPDAPNLPAMLSIAENRAKDERSYYQRKAIMLVVRRSWPVAVTVLVAVIGVMLGIVFVQSEVAWATVDGYLLEYKLEFDQHFSGTAVDPPDHPILQIERALAEWNAQHEQIGGAPIVEMEITRYNKTFEKTKYECYLRFRLLSDSDGLLKSLTGAMAATGLVDEPEVYSDTWYYSEKFPESYYVGRVVVINGKEYVFPTDFISDELSDIRGLLFSPDYEGEAYYGFYQLGEDGRIPLADVVKVSISKNGNISIVDVADGLDRREFQLLSYSKYLGVTVRASERGLDFDPVELLKAKYLQKRSSAVGGWGPVNFRGFRLVVDLKDEPGEIVQELDAVVLDWAQGYPELLPGGEAEILLESGTVIVDEKPVEWQVTFWRTDKGLATEIKGLLGQRGFEVKRMTLVVTTEDESQRNYYVPRATQGEWASPEFTASYILLDGMDDHGNNPFYYTDDLTPADRKAALDLCNQMEEKFEDWLENINRENIDYGGARPSFHKQTAPRTSPGGANVIRAVSVSTSVTEERWKKLLDAFAKLGAPEPRTTKSSDHVQQPRGFTAAFMLVRGKQLYGVAEEDATSIFSATGLEAHMELVDELEAVAKKWVEDNESLVAEESKPLQVKTRRFDYGGLPVHFIINTSIRQQENFDGFIFALRDAGAPEAKIFEPQPTGIPVFRGDDYFGNFYANQILAYHFRIPAVRVFGSNETEMMDMLTAEEVLEHHATIQRMQDALTEWNRNNPPAEGELPVELATREINGLVSEVALQSGRRDKGTMESLIAAMALEGVPDFRYGIAFQNSGMFSGRPSPPTKRVSGSSLGFTLIPYIYWNGEMQKNITREMRQEAQEKYNQASAIVSEWWKSHPELNELHPGQTLVEPSIEMPPLPQNGRERSFQVVIWSNDVEYCKKVLAELEEILSAVEGLPEIKVGHGGMGRGGA